MGFNELEIEAMRDALAIRGMCRGSKKGVDGAVMDCQDGGPHDPICVLVRRKLADAFIETVQVYGEVLEERTEARVRAQMRVHQQAAAGGPEPEEEAVEAQQGVSPELAQDWLDAGELPEAAPEPTAPAAEVGSAVPGMAAPPPPPEEGEQEVVEVGFPESWKMAPLQLEESGEGEKEPPF